MHFAVKSAYNLKIKTMIIREGIIRVTNTETGEVTEKSNMWDGKLYGLFSVTSNKTVRKNEKFRRIWWNRKKDVPSERMERTNRGWFIDGYQVDERSVNKWFELTGNDRNESPKTNKKWNSKKKHKKQSAAE